MAEEDTCRTGIPAVAVLAVALILLPTGTADASCSAGNRVDHRDAECLSGWWKNRGLLKKSPYHVRNMCPEYGKVVAKVDLKSARDRTLHLTDGLPRDGDTRHRIRGISCCSDIGELCNRSDIVTDEGCAARFNRVSPAAGSCWKETATAVISGDNYDCRISAMCMISGTMFLDRHSSISVPWLDLDEVRNCDSRLTRGPCPRPNPGASWLSVSDARVEEAEGASLGFTVTLSQALSERVTVRFATSDGTARAGSDYRETSGRLYFGPGQTEKTVSVPVLDDELDEGSETLTMTVWNLSPLQMSVADPIATGTIFNTDRMPTAWIARFGRTVPHRACGDLSGGSGVTRFPTATATRVNVEQASKRAMRRPTRRITGKAATGREASDARTGHNEVVECDLSNYFGEIPHAELLKSLARRIGDPARPGMGPEDRVFLSPLRDLAGPEGQVMPDEGLEMVFPAVAFEAAFDGIQMIGVQPFLTLPVERHENEVADHVGAGEVASAGVHGLEDAVRVAAGAACDVRR